MDDVKGLLESKTIWGALIAIFATISQLFGWDLGNTDGLAEQASCVSRRCCCYIWADQSC
jgi:hypothetical protein